MPGGNPTSLTDLVPLGMLQELADALTALAEVPIYFAAPDGRLLTRVVGPEGVCARFTAREEIARPCLSCARVDLDPEGRCWPRSDDLGATTPCETGLTDLALPLSCDGRVIGVLGSVQFVTEPAAFVEALRRLREAGAEPDEIEALRRATHYLDPDRARALGAAARSIAGLVVELASRALDARRVAAAAEEQAVRDPLTGVANRRQAERAVDTARSLAARHGRPFALMVIDLDHFKRVNDTHGHPTGDRVLVSFARLVERVIRPSDRLYRIGGEEFLLVCHETTRGAAHVLAERLRRAVAANRFGLPAPTTVTASVGLVAWESGPIPDGVPLVAAADAALYDAKQKGRDRVSVAQCPIAPGAAPGGGALAATV